MPYELLSWSSSSLAEHCRRRFQRISLHLSTFRSFHQKKKLISHNWSLNWYTTRATTYLRDTQNVCVIRCFISCSCTWFIHMFCIFNNISRWFALSIYFFSLYMFRSIANDVMNKGSVNLCTRTQTNEYVSFFLLFSLLAHVWRSPIIIRC